MDRKEARKLDPFAQYAMVVADEAIKDSNLPLSELDPNRIGVIWDQASEGCLLFRKRLNLLPRRWNPRFNPFFIPKMIPDLSAGHISIKYGFRDSNFVNRIGMCIFYQCYLRCFMYIRLGKADVIVSGGSEAAVCEAGGWWI